ncbi:MAG TPA: nucleotidyltransferase family protein [Blastocatellia bacterium]|nr:nucleotidyltransferase family protein [Blastocatellia bacterium]
MIIDSDFEAVLSPEAKVLVLAARVRLDAETSRQMRGLLEAGLRWDSLLSLAEWHKMKPLLCWHLTTQFADFVPPETLAELKESLYYQTARNLFLTARLLEILDLFERNGIQAIPYKGPVLAASVYGNLSLREFCDLDILVRRREVERASRLLPSLGYRLDLELTDWQQSSYIDDYCEHQFRHRVNETLVELQWAIVPPYFRIPLEYEGLWERAVSVEVAGRNVPALCPEDLLLVLCIHGGKHQWETLEWVCGVAELIRVHKEIDWARVVEHSIEIHARRVLFLGLSLAARLAGAPIPRWLWRRVEDDVAVRRLTHQVYRDLFSEAEQPAALFQRSLFHLKSKERWEDRVYHCLDLAMRPTAKDWVFLSLPRRLSLLYYAVRGVRLTMKYLPSTLKSPGRKQNGG